MLCLSDIMQCCAERPRLAWALVLVELGYMQFGRDLAARFPAALISSGRVSC